MKMFYFYFLYSNIENALKPKGSARFFKKLYENKAKLMFSPSKIVQSWQNYELWMNMATFLFKKMHF